MLAAVSLYGYVLIALRKRSFVINAVQKISRLSRLTTTIIYIQLLFENRFPYCCYFELAYFRATLTPTHTLAGVPPYTII